jgi:hypothetical protein
VSEQEAEKQDGLKSRRALLTAAAASAAALAAQAAVPLAARADDPNDVVKEVNNVTTDTTGIDSSATADVNAFSAAAGGTGNAVVATAEDAPAIAASNTGADVATAMYVTSGDATDAAPLENTAYTGAYGFTEVVPEFLGTGLWGDSLDTGVLATGANTGTIGYGFWGVYGESSSPGGIGIYAYAPSTDRRALYVDGKVGFRRSGRTTISAGQSSRVISLTGVSSSSLVFAQIASNRSGRWVRAVVPTTGKFTIYLNTSVTVTTYVIWWVIN